MYNAAFGTRLIRRSYQVILISDSNTRAMYSKPESEVSDGLSYVLPGH